VEAKVEAKARKKVGQEEHRAAMALAASSYVSKGVYWQRNRFKWEVLYRFNGKRRHLGSFDFDDHAEAVALYKRTESKTKTELEALFIRP
jgi:hypothetical protein